MLNLRLFESPRAGLAAIVFETDGKKVLMIRAGRYPEADWVEDCSQAGPYEAQRLRALHLSRKKRLRF